MELVAVGLHFLEKAADTGERPVALVDQRALRRRQLRVRRVDVDTAPLRRPQQLALVPLARGRGPWLDRAVGEAPRRIRDHERLVVSQDVAETLALRACAERVIEGEEQRSRALDRDVAGGAAELAGEDARAAADHVDPEPPRAFEQRRLDGLGDPLPLTLVEDHAVEDDVDLPDVGQCRRGRRREIEHRAVDRDAGEAATGEIRPEPSGFDSRRHGLRMAEQRPGARVLGQQRVDDAIHRVTLDETTAARAMHAADFGVQESQVIVDFGRGPDGRAGGPHGILLLEGDRGPDVLDPVHVGPVHALEEQARVRG